MKTVSRLFVISDLHLGGDAPSMMSHPEALSSFIDGLPAHRGTDEDVELVIAGDFVDFLAIPPQACWTPDADVATAKLQSLLDAPFSIVVSALRRFLATGHDLTLLVGNHDVELALPPVQDALCRMLDTPRHRVRFVDDGRAYRRGGLLIEHGNRYDEVNGNDWTHLRAIGSALSRTEAPPVRLEVSAGSRIVETVVNPIKARYPFIDLLQPQNELVALLLLAFEPKLIWHWDKIGRMVRAARLQRKNREGAQPGRTTNVSGQGNKPLDAALDAAFDEPYRSLMSMSTATEDVGAIDDLHVVIEAQRESLSEILDRRETIPKKRLEQIRVVLARILADDESLSRQGPTEQYGRAAERMGKGGVQTVVMGHTHLARHIGPETLATYINTGTWADLIQVPGEAVMLGNDAALNDFLIRLKDDRNVRGFVPTYAEITLDETDRVLTAALEEFRP